jgi:hypothetical protein
MLGIHVEKDNHIKKGWAIFIKESQRLKNDDSTIKTINFK